MNNKREIKLLDETASLFLPKDWNAKIKKKIW